MVINPKVEQIKNVTFNKLIQNDQVLKHICSENPTCEANDKAAWYPSLSRW